MGILPAPLWSNNSEMVPKRASVANGEVATGGGTEEDTEEQKTISFLGPTASLM